MNTRDVFDSTMRLDMCLRQFDGVQPVAETKVERAAEEGPVTVAFAGAQWELAVSMSAVGDRPDGMDGVFTARVAGGRASSVNASISLVDTAWSKAGYVMLPAAAYNGNRFHSRRLPYPPLATRPEDLQEHPEPMIGDVPRLNIEDGPPSSMHIQTGDETTPCLCYYSPDKKRGCILLTRQGNDRGNFGIKVAESMNRDSVTLTIESPVVRPGMYGGNRTDYESPDHAAELEPGDCIDIPFRLFVFPARSIQALYSRFVEVRKDLTGPVHLVHTLSFSASWRILEEKTNRDNWNSPYGYYAVGTRNKWENGNHDRHQDWQVGWTGGGMNSLPLLAIGNPVSRERALQTLEFMFSRAQSNCGLFYAGHHDGKLFHDSFDEKMDRDWVMVRKNTDALYFLLKHFVQLRKNPGWELPMHWETGTRKLADCLTGMYDRYGQFGQFLDVATGDMIVGGSTAGALGPGALALAGQCFDEPRYIDTAVRSGEDYYQAHVRAGVTTGGPGEIMQAPDSESAFAMLESLVLLYEVTGDRAWLPKAEEMADQCTTWCASYDYRFPDDSFLGKLDIRAAGSVWANVQNKHSAPGICTFSGDSLLKLNRATGQIRFLDVITEIAHNLPQYVCREDRQVGPTMYMKPGMICERVNFSDWEGIENIGGNLFGSCWPEVSLALTTIEIPGLYVQTDTGFVRTIDHVNAAVTERDADSMTLEIRNPTPFDATVRVLSETSATARKTVLGQMSVVDLPTVTVEAGRAIKVRCDADGNVMV